MRCCLRLWWCAGKKGKGGGKKGSKLVLTLEVEQLLTHVCCCLALLVAGDNADCYRVAAAGCLKALVQLGSESRNTQLRRAAKVRRPPQQCIRQPVRRFHLVAVHPVGRNQLKRLSPSTWLPMAPGPSVPFDAYSSDPLPALSCCLARRLWLLK
jgi:hypothetical protein